MRFRHTMLPVAAVFVVAAFFTPARAQWDGYIDYKASLEQQAARLEQRVGGDAPAYKQAVVYQWLIQLYTALDRLDDAEAAFRQILVFFPGDVGTRNAYARFLIEERGDLDRAGEELADAYEWAKARDARSLEIATTLRMQAEVNLARGNYETAVSEASEGREYAGETELAALLRAQGRALCGLSRFDEAADVFIELIAHEGGADREDINELKTFVGKADDYDAAKLNDVIARAIDDAYDERRKALEAEGGEIVHIKSSDGVELEATVHRGDDAGAVLFIPELGSRRSVFRPYAQLFAVEGYTTLAVDLRGHGNSRSDTLLSFETMTPAQRSLLIDDVAAAMTYLRDAGFDDEHMVVVSEGAACAVVEKAMYLARIQPRVACLSPEFAVQDAELRTAFAFHRDRPTLMFFADEDIDALRSTQLFADTHPISSLERRSFPHGGRGIDLLRRVPDALARLLAWTARATGRPEPE